MVHLIISTLLPLKHWIQAPASWGLPADVAQAPSSPSPASCSFLPLGLCWQATSHASCLSSEPPLWRSRPRPLCVTPASLIPRFHHVLLNSFPHSPPSESLICSFMCLLVYVLSPLIAGQLTREQGSDLLQLCAPGTAQTSLQKNVLNKWTQSCLPVFSLPLVFVWEKLLIFFFTE